MQGAQTRWVTLSMMDDIGESPARRDGSTWLERWSKATGREVVAGSTHKVGSQVEKPEGEVREEV